MDPTHILQMSLYSKLITDFSGHIFASPTKCVLLCVAIFTMKMIPSDVVEQITTYIKQRTDDNISSVIIPTHKKSYFSGALLANKESKRTLFSPRFRGINAYLLKHKKKELFKLVETPSFEWDEYSSSSITYILLPHDNTKVKICDKHAIYFEVIVQEDKSNDDEKTENSLKKIFAKSSDKNYIYKLSMGGKGNMHIIESFIDNCITDYKLEHQNKKVQCAFEYMKTQKDDEDKMQIVYTKTPFKSNKYLDQNIFYEQKQEVIEYVDRFAKPSDSITTKSDYELEYERSGVTFKASILLEGPPGCGKSATIKGIANRTKRNLVLVSWSKIETCNEFINIFRNTTIKDVNYSLRELLFVFEDFDANSNQVLKSRKNEELDSDTFSPIDMDMNFEEIPDPVGELSAKENETLKKYKRILKKMKATINEYTKKTVDELTLECVLNTLDGIMELHDAMMIFTTNHIENIDEAFLRPGRIDKIVHLSKATVNTIKEMVGHKFGLIENMCDITYSQYFDKMRDCHLSPAEVQNIIFKFSKNEVEKCLQAIVAKMQ